MDRIAFTRVKLRYPRLVGRNSSKGIHGYGPDLTICSLYTKQGAKGIGMLRDSEERAGKAFESMKGKKLTDVFNPQIGALSKEAMIFDIPLHDLAGIITSQPVYKLLGREKPFVTKCYSGMIYMDDLDPLDNPSGLDKIFEECQYDYSKGYRQFKLKIGRGKQWMPLNEGIKRDIEVTKLVHNYFPDVDILVDANDGYTVSDFIHYMEGIEDVPVWWIEEPFREKVDDFTVLRNWLNSNRRRNTLLADGEAHPDLPLALEMGRKGVLDVYLDDIMGYGFTQWRALTPVLKENQMLGSPHNWGDYLKTIYTMHLAAGLGNVCTIEGVTCFSNDIDFGHHRLENGILIPADTPGFGMVLLKQ
ncbi:MAG TPA: enolase C-terminal domain-like protein [Niabella sp.]|nr:enolase C-terminal domain-like protein [Niabella sp.]